MQVEPNNLISEATDSALNFNGDRTVTFSNSIDKVSDIDLYRFELERGQGITLDINTNNAANTANFDSFLRVFDADGKELAFNDDSAQAEVSDLDSYLGFIANSTGEYYVGVSSFANKNYNPLNGDVDLLQDNFVPGAYDLTLNIVEVIADSDPDNTITEAINSELGRVSSTAIAGTIETESDVDFYRFELKEGEGIEIESLADESDLDSYLRLFDADGEELAFNDNGNNSNITFGNSAIALAPPPGTYYVGVSSTENEDYDEVNGDTNLSSSNTGTSAGDYNLELSIVEIITDSDPDNTVAEAIQSGVNPTGLDNTVLNGEIDVQTDVDLYQFELAEGEGVYLDIKAEALNSDLNSLLRVFDAEGNELALDDNNDANYTENYSPDAKLAFLPETAGTYYVGVGTSDHLDYDPIAGRNNFSREIANPYSTTGSYELAINTAEVIGDRDLDNTIAEVTDGGLVNSSTVISDAIEAVDDADLYQFQLAEGEGVTLDLDTTGSDLDSYLRLFDANGNELAFDNDDESNFAEDSGTDSLLNFVADAGTYFVGISSDGNTNYDAVTGRNNFTPTTGFSTGSYDLAIEIAPVVVDSDPDNTIAEATDTQVDSSNLSASFSDTIDTRSDVDFYQLQLDRGETVAIDIDATESGSTLDSALQIFDAKGNKLTTNDDGSAPDENSSSDSYVEFTAATMAEYYVGISSFDNLNYNAIAGSNNFSNELGSTTGSYELTIALLPEQTP